MDSQIARKRLMNDLRELENSPVPGISAIPLQTDLFTWHINLYGPVNSPYEGGIFHLEMKFPKNYPTESPSVTVFTFIPHPHVIRNRICLDLLSDYKDYFLDDNADVGTGWSSAYTVRTILMQLQTFLMDLDEIEDDSLSSFLQKVPSAIEESLTFSCLSCPHNPAYIHPVLSIYIDEDEDEDEDANEDEDEKEKNEGNEMKENEMNDNDKAKDDQNTSILNNDNDNDDDQITKMNDDDNDDDDEKSKKEKNLKETENILICFHTKRTMEEEILGTGVSFEISGSGKIKKITSSFDTLSYSAFNDGVRLDSMNKEFTHWIPFYINSKHAIAAKPLAIQIISNLFSETPKSFNPLNILQIFPNLMCQLVVDIFKRTVHASFKALSGYCAIHRLFLMFVEEYPSILNHVNQIVGNFISNPHFRSKKTIPSLGEFLILLNITNYTWDDIAESYIYENLDRNVFWLLQDHPELDKSEYDPNIDQSRNTITFNCNCVGFKLLLFNLKFMELIGRPLNMSLDQIAENYDKSNGIPSEELQHNLQILCKQIALVNSWEEFFQGIRLKQPSEEELNQMLRQAVSNSRTKGYHKSRNIGKGNKQRAQYDKAFNNKSHNHNKNNQKKTNNNNNKNDNNNHYKTSDRNQQRGRGKKK